MFLPTLLTLPQINRPRLGVTWMGAAGVVSRTPLPGAASTVPCAKNLLHDSSAVERRAVNATVTGSIPVRAAITVEVKRIGRQLVLKTSARKGCGFESMPPPPLRQRHPHTSWTTGRLMGDRQEVRQPALNRFIAGSTPALPGLCLSSSSLRLSVVGRTTRARIPPGTPHFRERSSAVGRHLWRCLLMVRKSGFQPENASSILVGAANCMRPCSKGSGCLTVY
jgi:hypothetical protein